MADKPIKILAIETSCDETAAAILGEENGLPVILSSIISSQIDLHAKTGGVVPEVASRAHVEAMIPVLTDALLNSNIEYRISKQSQSSNLKNSKPISDFREVQADLSQITHIAVTNGPGLIGSLLVGFNAAKTLSFGLDLPIIPVNHIEGHIYSAFSGEVSKFQAPNPKQITNSNLKNSKIVSDFGFRDSIFPLLALTVSGGHTSLTLMKDHGEYETVGQTIDDAVGEAYDKVAKMLGLGYPGGPIISKMADHFRNKFPIPKSQIPNKFKNQNFKFRKTGLTAEQNIESMGSEINTLDSKLSTLNITFPRPIINDGTFDFSFSGLKTAVLIFVKKYLIEKKIENAIEINLAVKQEIAAAFEEAVKDVLVAKTLKAVLRFKPASVIFAGGVSANEYLRTQIELGIKNYGSGAKFLTPKSDMFGDNAAMIGIAAYYHIKRGDLKSWGDIRVDSNLEL